MKAHTVCRSNILSEHCRNYDCKHVFTTAYTTVKSMLEHILKNVRRDAARLPIKLELTAFHVQYF